MSEASLLIVGCGDLGERVGRIVGPRGWSVTGTRRRPEASEASFPYLAADYSSPGSLAFAETMRPDFLLATFTPTTPDIQGYRQGFRAAAENLLAGLGAHRLKHLLMVSSTRVYAESTGGWVDEASALSSTDERAVEIIAAEQLLLASQQPVTIVRCAGIYGKPGGRLIAKIAQGRVAPAQPVRYTNRIHRQDCAGFLVHLLTQANEGQSLADVYNGVDDEPAPAHEVETWLADALGVEPLPAAGPAGAAEEGKRCSNSRLRASGYELQFPNYRAGYRHTLESDPRSDAILGE